MLAWNIIMLLKYPPSVQNMTILNTWLDSNNELCVPHQGQQRQSLLRNTCSYPCGGLSSLPQTIDHWGYIPRGKEGGREGGKERGREGEREGGREGGRGREIKGRGKGEREREGRNNESGRSLTISKLKHQLWSVGRVKGVGLIKAYQ